MTSNTDIQLNSGMRCAKYLLLIVSLMFGITGVLLIMIGSTIQALLSDFRPFVYGHFLSPSALLIAIGFILLFVATLGAYGAIRESVMCINLYGVFLFLVLILEVSAAIAAFVMKGQVREMLEITMHESLADYESSDYSEAVVDVMQKGLQCCGVDGPNDWLKYMNESKWHMENKIEVPYSCCDMYYAEYANHPAKCVNKLQDGCIDGMELIVSQSVILIGVGAITVAFVQLLGSICAFMLAKTLRRHKSIREARRWQLQQMQQSLDVLIAGSKMAPPMNSPTTGYTQLENEPMSFTPNSPSVIN